MSGEYKRYYWLKLQEDFFEDDTIDFIESQESGERYILFYLKLCLKALKYDGKLIRYVGNTLIPYDEAGLAKLTNTDINVVKSAVRIFTEIGLIEQLETGEIFISQLNEMVGSESEHAKYVRKSRQKQNLGHNVTSLVTDEGHIVKKNDLDIEIDIDKDKEIDTHTENACVCEKNNFNNTHNDNIPAYIKEPYKNTKAENADLLQTCHNLILEHNAKNPVHSISVNKVFEYFKQTYNQGMAISRLNQMATVDEIVEALKNYLLVANSKTWRNTFSITGFCNSYVDFTKEFFDMRKFINMPRDKVKCVKEQLSKALINKQFFRRDTFIYHREDWFNLGMPEGEDLVNLVNKWLKEDEQKNINYAIVNDKWEEENDS